MKLDVKKTIFILFASLFLFFLVYFGSISGYVVKTNEIGTDFPVDAWGFTGWGECKDQQGTWEQINDYCEYKGYIGANPDEEKPCYHVWNSKRWGWDGKSPMQKRGDTGAGYALVKVKCLSDEEDIDVDYEPELPAGEEQEPIQIPEEPLDVDYEPEPIVGGEQTPIYIPPFCDDPDWGYQPYNRQTEVRSTLNGKSTDKCENGYLIEYFCDGNTGEMKFEFYDCKKDGKVCYGGACTKAYCEFIWPQKIITADKTYGCILPNIPYCNVQEAAKGNLKCCNYINGAYTNCQDMTSLTEFFDIASCVWTWPQKVKYYGKEYSCGTLSGIYRPWCNNDKAQKGIAECCKEHSPYRDCVKVA